MDQTEEYTNEYELRDLQQRVISLNERMIQREVDMHEFRNALAVKEAELQNALSDASRHSTQYNNAKMDLVNMERQITETEKRVHLKEQENDNLKQRLFSIESTKDQLSKTYYQALSDLKSQLENSQQIIFQLEQKAGDNRQGNNQMVDIVRSVREASSLELKRMVNEAKEKFDLMLSDVKLQRDEIKKNAMTLSEENSILRSQVDHLLAELSSTHEKLMMSDNQQAILMQNFENDRRTMQLHIKNVEETLQKTQDLLLMKIQDLEITKEKVSSPQTDLLSYFPSKIQPPRFEEINYLLKDVTTDESAKETSEDTPAVPVIKTKKLPPNRPFSAPVTSSLKKRLNAPARLSARTPSKTSSIKVNNPEQFMQSFGPPPLNKKLLEPEETEPVEKLERPASASMKRFLGPNDGRSDDYFDAMFHDSRGHSLHSSGVESFRSPFNLSAKFDAIAKENEHSNAVGSLKVVQIDRNGAFVEIANMSSSQEISVGGFMVQQNIGGHPAAIFRFPPRTRLAARSTCMVWSDKAIEGIHNPPADYLAANINKWSTGPESTTILCKPNGQAVSWLTNKQIHRTYRNSLLGTYADVQKGISRQNYDSDFLKTVPVYDGKPPVLFQHTPRTNKQTPTINRPKQYVPVS